MTKRTVRDTKAQATHDAAMSIISREQAASAAKIARLRKLREAQQPRSEAKSTVKKRGAIPVPQVESAE